jgi:D-threo-aldose 1-dehydrogenase
LTGETLAVKDNPDTEVPTRPLGRSGLRVGPFAFGGAVIGNLYQAVDDEVAAGAVEAALRAGVRYFDTAPHYGLGLSERRLGRALAGQHRAELVLSTKVGRLLVDNPAGATARDDEGFDVPATARRVLDYSRDGVLRSIESSLTRLGTDRVDVVFVHDPDDHYREALDGAFPALSELRAQGVISGFGAGMNQSAMLAEFVRHTDLDVVMLAGRYSLLDQSAVADLLPLAAQHKVSVVAAGVFNSGILATDRPRADAHYNYAPAEAELIDRATRIAQVCERHGVALPTAAAQFPLRHPTVATVCLGARSATQVDRNAGLFSKPVPDDLWQELAATGLIRADSTP